MPSRESVIVFAKFHIIGIVQITLHTMERTRRRWIKIDLDSHPIIHHKQRRQCKHSSLAPELLKPCPFEYDSAYSSLFIPTHNQYKRLGRSRSRPHRGECQFTNASFDETHPPPPWCSTYEKELIGFCYLPSLRRTMLVGLGLSPISSFVYCVQFLYPPLLALYGPGPYDFRRSIDERSGCKMKLPYICGWLVRIMDVCVCSGFLFQG